MDVQPESVSRAVDESGLLAVEFTVFIAALFEVSDNRFVNFVAGSSVANERERRFLSL